MNTLDEWLDAAAWLAVAGTAIFWGAVLAAAASVIDDATAQRGEWR